MATTQTALNQTAANIAQTVITRLTNGAGDGNPRDTELLLANAILALVAYNQNVPITGIKVSPATR